MKLDSTLFTFLLFLCIFSSCTTFSIVETKSKPEILVNPVEYQSSEGVPIARGQQYQFPGTVEHFEYMPQSKQFTATYFSKRKNAEYGLFDAQSGVVEWAHLGSRRLSLLTKDFSFAESDGVKMLLRNKNGTAVRKITNDKLVVIDDSVVINLTNPIQRINLNSGNPYWERPGLGSYSGWTSDQLDGDWMYVVAKGVHGFNLRTGKGWYQKMKTDYDPKGAGTAAFNVLSIFLIAADLYFGGTGEGINLTAGQRVHNIHTVPVIGGEHLYFANRDEAYCLDKKSGKINWKNTFDKEIGASDFRLLPNGTALLVSKGFRFIDYNVELYDRPMLYILDAHNGRILHENQLPKEEIIIHSANNDAYTYALGPSKVYQFGSRLEALANFEIPIQYGKALRVVTWSSSSYNQYLRTDQPDFPLVIRTTKGVLGLHPVTLEELWFQDLGLFKEGMISGMQWWEVLGASEQEQFRSWIDSSGELFWFSKQSEVVGLDLRQQGKEIANIKFGTDNFHIKPTGELVYQGLDKVQILKLGIGRP